MIVMNGAQVNVQDYMMILMKKENIVMLIMLFIIGKVKNMNQRK